MFLENIITDNKRKVTRLYIDTSVESVSEWGRDMRLIDAEKLLASMDARYCEKKNIVPDTLAEGFMQMDKLIKEQNVVDLDAHDKQIRADEKTKIIDEVLELLATKTNATYWIKQLKEQK